MSKCLYCNSQIVYRYRNYNLKFCNQICYHNYRRIKPNKKIEFHCIVCNKSLKDYPSQVSKHPTCSRECCLIWRHNNYKQVFKDKIIYINCDNCGKKIYKKPSHIKRHKHHFCNQICESEWHKDNRPKIKCHFCGKELSRKLSMVGEKNFCKECMPIWKSITRKGKNNPMFGMNKEKNPNWNGGTAYSPYPFSFDEFFKKEIRSRDNHKCQICYRLEKELIKTLIVHHTDYNKLNTCKENCISLCESCHGKTQHNRTQWTKYFRSLLNEKYGYQYVEEQKIIYDFVNNQIRQET